MKFIVLFLLSTLCLGQNSSSLQEIQRVAQNYQGPVSPNVVPISDSNFGYLSTIVSMKLRKDPKPLGLIHKKITLRLNDINKNSTESEQRLKEILMNNLGSSKAPVEIPFYITYRPKQKTTPSDLMVNIPGTYAESNSAGARHVAFTNALENKVVMTLPNPMSKEYYKLNPKFDFGNVEKYAETYNAIVALAKIKLQDKDNTKQHKFPLKRAKFMHFKNTQLTGYSLGSFIATEMAASADKGTYQAAYLLSPPKDLLQSIKNLDYEKEHWSEVQKNSDVNLERVLHNFLTIKNANFKKIAQRANSLQDKAKKSLEDFRNLNKTHQSCPLSHLVHPDKDELNTLQKRAKYLFVFSGFEKKRQEMLDDIHEAYERNKEENVARDPERKKRAHNFTTTIANYSSSFTPYFQEEEFVPQLGKKLPRSSLAYQISKLESQGVNVAVLTSRNDPINSQVQTSPTAITLRLSDNPIMPDVQRLVGPHYIEVKNGDGHTISKKPYEAFSHEIDRTFLR